MSCRCSDYGVTEDERPYIVMEWLDGEPLDVLVRKRGPLSLPDVATVVRHVGKALGKAHGMGVVHRDIKPANLFNVGDDDLFIKVLDFGIAKQAELGANSITMAGEVTGTPRFMSPEQLADSKDVDERTDVWAVGVVAYRLLTGQFPFAAQGLSDLYMDICAGRFAAASSLRDDLPPSVDEWIKRCLTVDREGRIQNAETMVAEFPFQRVGTTRPSRREARPLPAAKTIDDDALETLIDTTEEQQRDEDTTVVQPKAIEHAAPRVGAQPATPTAPAPAQDAITRASPEPMIGVPAGTEAGLVMEEPAPPKRRGGVAGVAALVVLLGAAATLSAITLFSPPEEPTPAVPSVATTEETSAPSETDETAAISHGEPATTSAAPLATSLVGQTTNQTEPPSGQPPLRANSPPFSSPPSSSPPSRAQTSKVPATAPPTASPKDTPRPVTSGRTVDCSGDNAYIVDGDGHLIPKPGCM